MSELTPEEEDIYRSLKLRLIIDLRRDDEVTERPTPLFNFEDNIHISVSDPDNAFAEAAAKAHEPDAENLILADATRYYREVVTDNLHRYTPVLTKYLMQIITLYCFIALLVRTVLVLWLRLS